MRTPLLLVVAVLVSGCTLPWQPEDGGPGITRPTVVTPPPSGPPLTFGGHVRDALDGEPVTDAALRLDLAQVRPCRREGIVWREWEMAARSDGAFGPLEIPRPNSDDVAFFLHTRSTGYSPDVRVVGPAEAREDLGNLTIVLHPRLRVDGTAPPGTPVAMEALPFPRVTVADAEGVWAFDDALVGTRGLVVGTDPPHARVVTPPETVTPPSNGTAGWRLEGSLRDEEGRPVAADLVARNATHLVGVARAAESGAFVMPLPARGDAYVLEARTSDGALGGSKRVELQGPPALRESLVLRPLC